MLIVLSPAKRMNMIPGDLPGSRPEFMSQAVRLAKRMKALSPGMLEGVLKVNPQLAMKAYMDYQDMDLSLPGTAAIFSYQGLAYRYLDGATLTGEDLGFAQEHLRILSGFYGLLRPMDGIRPHRLEMGHRLPGTGESLYAFWGDRLYRSLYRRGEPVVNLASGEYARAITPYLLKGNSMVHCEFFVISRGRYKVLATAAKMARGAMARYAIESRVNDPWALSGFSAMGFRFSSKMSTENIYRFYQEREDDEQ